jgi:hypothetical protein
VLSEDLIEDFLIGLQRAGLDDAVTTPNSSGQNCRNAKRLTLAAPGAFLARNRSDWPVGGELVFMRRPGVRISHRRADKITANAIHPH